MSQYIIVVGAGGVGAETLKLLAEKMPGNSIRVIDRDFVDTDTLARQTLYTKKDLGKLKAKAVEEKLGSRFKGVCEHLDEDNAETLLSGADIILDCTDNWQTRCVINQFALKNRVPWIFTSAIRQETMCATLTAKTACFVCFNPTPTQPRSCRVEGIRKETTAMAAETQVAELTRLLTKKPTLAGKLQYTDLKLKACVTKEIKKNNGCQACVKKTFRLPKAQAVTLCGDGEYLFQLKSSPNILALAYLKPEKYGNILKIKWKDGELALFNTGRVLTRNLSKSTAQSAITFLEQI